MAMCANPKNTYTDSLANEVWICGIDAAHHQLIDADGNRFEEVETNLWGRVGAHGSRRAIYLGTGKHGGGITLRLLYKKNNMNEWVNVFTNCVAPFDADSKELW